MDHHRPVDQYTLREKFTEAELLTRELYDHVEKGFVPKVHALGRLVRPPREGMNELPVEDQLIRTSTAQILENDQFTERLSHRLMDFCRSIDSNIDRVLSGE